MKSRGTHTGVAANGPDEIKTKKEKICIIIN